MIKAARRYLRAAGSMMDIMPSTSYMELAASGSDYDALRGDLIRVGSDMKRAAGNEFKARKSQCKAGKATAQNKERSKSSC